MKRSGILTALLIVIGSAQMVLAEEALEIVKKADGNLIGNKIYSISEMTVYRSGKARPTMEVEGFSMAKNGEDYSLSIYRKPAKMKGTAYLMIGDDLWVKFASTGRTRKLSSSAKKNSAGGTDFSYADMGESSQGISAKYNVRMENSKATVAGDKCYEISFHPQEGTEGVYEKLVAYIAKESYRYLRIDYYEAGAVIKSLTLSDYRQVAGRDYP
ncbi:MAG: outer membrane lipoprotein-sorting protein, partial [Spirochaeta sp.]|nr:outer membrane lipoprotein-sorting protein [Spirochaeta sp.]